MATLATYLDNDDEIIIIDERVEPLEMDDEPDMVVIQVYITSAYRAYQIADHYRAKGAYICLGGLHVTSLPEEAAMHADTIFIGPGEDIWPAFLCDFHAGQPKKEYWSQKGIETATFHILTPYPGTVLHERMNRDGRILTSNWDLYDTRHTVFTPAKMTPETLENGYWYSYQEFYKWTNIIRSGRVHDRLIEIIRHIAYTGGWKKFELLWDWVIRAKRVASFLPLLEFVLNGFGSSKSRFDKELNLIRDEKLT